MKNDLQSVLGDPEHAYEAYNAVFCDLGLPWYWDKRTYAALLLHSPDPRARIRHYIEEQHPHLLTAYDAGVLAMAIHERALRYKPSAQRRFDGPQPAAWEVGV